MFRRLMVIAAAASLTLVPTLTRAEESPGFRTGSCALDDLFAPGETVVAPGGSGNPALQVGSGKQYTTIGAAVAAAAPNDHIVVFPGEYNESVVVDTPGLRITGVDRDTVVLDGEATKATSQTDRQFGILVTADRVVVENMTGHHYAHTAFYWFGVTGYWGRYLTAYNNGLYGIYSRDARCGVFDHSFGSGNADAAYYIGECFPCDAVIADVEATGNGLGYSGTNAGGNLTIRDSWFHHNALGLAPNSLDSEKAPPQRGTTIENNLIEANSVSNAPGAGTGAAFYGVGVAIAGGQANMVIGNTVTGHVLAGIVLAPLPSDYLYVSGGNTIWGNTVTGSGLADLAQGATSGPSNCWDHNTYETTAPPVGLETIWGCTNSDDDPPKLPFYPGPTPPGGDPRVEQGLFEGFAGLNGRVLGDWDTWPAPTCAASPSSCENLPDETPDSSYVNDGGVDLWLAPLL